MTIVTVLMAVASAAAGDAQPPAIVDTFVLSDIDQGRAEVRFELSPEALDPFQGASADVTVHYPDGSKRIDSGLRLGPGGADFQASLIVDVDPVLVWHPRTPNLYGIDVVVRGADGSPLATAYRRFGMRKLETRSGRFFVNNEPFFLRACGHEQEATCDNLDRVGALKRLRQVRRYGFNAVRHHSHVPSEVYLDAADEVGVLIQMEISGKIGTDPESARFQQSRQDWIDMIRRGRSHPCTFVYSMGNEIYKNETGLIACQDALYDLAKEMDPGVLVLNRSGSNPFNDPFGKYDLIERPIGEYEHVAELAREAFVLYLRGDRKGRSDDYPIVAHEYPLVAAYPNTELAGKYAQTPSWLRLTVENARREGLEHLLPEFTRNAQRIQTLCRKEMLEEARKFPELDGYSMLRFTDCEGRVSGVVDDLADTKDVSAEEFLRTNGQTVLLCTPKKRSLRFGDTLEAKLEISHHGPTPYSAPACRWWLLAGPRLLAEGQFDGVSVEAVDVASVGTVSVTVPDLPAASKLTLRAALPDSCPYVNNEWYFWAFPADTVGSEKRGRVVLWDPRHRMRTYLDAYPDLKYVDDAGWTATAGETNLVITDSWQDSFYGYLEAGGRIWVISDKSWPWPEEVGIFGLHITRFAASAQAPVVFPEFDEHCAKWLTICSNAKSRYGNSGTVIYPHPALRNFPHEGFCDLHFWPMIRRAKTLQLDRFPAGTEPLIRAIDSYHRGRSKGYLVELEVGRGTVLVSTLNLTQSFARDVATAYTFDQLLRYMLGPVRQPSARMTAGELRKMIDDFAVESAERAPLIHDEMPARYNTRWRWLLGAGELITLAVYDAVGIDENRLAVHWEYAQTQWYLDGRPGDRLTWEFDVRADGHFAGTLHLAGPLKDVELFVQVDDGKPVGTVFPGSDGWEQFVPVAFRLPRLSAGQHRLNLVIGPAAPTAERRSVQIREVELRSVDGAKTE